MLRDAIASKIGKVHLPLERVDSDKSRKRPNNGTSFVHSNSHSDDFYPGSDTAPKYTIWQYKHLKILYYFLLSIQEWYFEGNCISWNCPKMVVWNQKLVCWVADKFRMFRRANYSFDTVSKYFIPLIQTPKYHKSNKTHLKVKRNMKKAKVTNVLLHCRLQSIFRLFNIHHILPGFQSKATRNRTLCDLSVATRTMQKIEMQPLHALYMC